MRKSLTLKMFTTTLVVITITLVLVFISQYIYFNKFYEDHKISKLVDQLNLITNDFSFDENKNAKLIKDFNNTNNAYLSVTTDNIYNLKNTSVLMDDIILVTSLDNNMNYIDIIFTSEQFNSLSASQLIERGSILFANGYYEDAESIIPTTINNVIMSGSTNANMPTFEGELQIVEVIDLSSKPSGLFGQAITINDLAIKTGVEHGVDFLVTSIPYTSTRQVDLHKTVTIEGVTTEFWVNASLLSIDESSDALKSFFPYFMLFAFVITFVVSLYYSKSVSKPIVKITANADLISNLDFSESLTSNRKDELGNLSRSLNKLSSNLENALTDLSSANTQLTIEYENEVKQEKARKEFVANVSHEIKTPLGVIKSYTEGIRDAVKKDKIEYYLDVILDEVSNMDTLVVELLDLAKFDAGKVQFNKIDVDIEKVLTKCVHSFNTATVDRQLNIILKGSFTTVLGDEQQLYRAFSNMIHNAIKYALPNTDIVIEGRVDTHQILSFSNTYDPIPKEDIPKLWHRFYKADTSHNRDDMGTGLGLSIVSSILDGHNATYKITTDNDQITFTFEFKKNS